MHAVLALPLRQLTQPGGQHTQGEPRQQYQNEGCLSLHLKRPLTCSCPPQAEQTPLSSTVVEDSSHPVPCPARGPPGANTAAAAPDLQRTGLD